MWLSGPAPAGPMMSLGSLEVGREIAWELSGGSLSGSLIRTPNCLEAKSTSRFTVNGISQVRLFLSRYESPTRVGIGTPRTDVAPGAKSTASEISNVQLAVTFATCSP